ncbi:MAG: methyltransferase [Pseudomonadota bacterium]
MDLVAGFVHTQVLLALVELNILERIRGKAMTAEALTEGTDIAPQRMAALLQAGASLGLLRRSRRGKFVASRRGAALLGVPGLIPMIRHNRLLYRDLEDPVALMKGTVQSELAAFWPYVHGAGAATDGEAAANYSDLMAQSQALVAQETLRAVNLKTAEHILDVGGGTGSFLIAAAAAAPKARLTLFDLPSVLEGAHQRLVDAGLTDRVRAVSGSFRDDPLPTGADRISLIRVLYDHMDDTVERLLAAVFEALQPGGLLIVSEPMSGGRRPERSGDAYFAFYTMAMGTGRTRSAEEIGAMMTKAGFAAIQTPTVRRPYVTSVVIGKKPV